ncbi:hypothetical protein HB662_02680 [Roseomonas frigidaquae]|uniref:Zinc finger/thioredoxin putative domain-containing protein n=1 Tax=Falsiroseomonas frigidaquae TaxID=487318 RepID=A0ABX1ET24_9PROT|nr:zinc-ribbon domain-containing protein [Falsiroseomonas frigidaquae]NKE43665.1 hypothetical protein [Falsiroseomonas frigidaquae]
MRISCPSCSAEYDVPDQALAAGPRTLRCARCGHSFRAALPEPPATESEPPPRSIPPAAPPAPGKVMGAPTASPTESARTPPPPPGAAAQDRLADAPSSPPDRFALAGWLVTLLVLALAAYAGYAFRAEIMTAWPPSQRLYALLGLA